MKGLLEDKKNLVILLLSILFIIKIFIEGARFASWVLAGVFFCFALNFALNYILKKRHFPNSAIISGFIVSGILDCYQPWLVLFIFCSLAILSKQIIRFQGRHIFNPANFGLFCATLFKMPFTWNIESNIPLIIIFGLYFAYAYKKFPHILGFLGLFMGLSIIFRLHPAISWFFVFIMLIEPKTSGYGRIRGLIFGGISGVIAFLIFKSAIPFDPFISSLFVANLFNPALDKINPVTPSLKK